MNTTTTFTNTQGQTVTVEKPVPVPSARPFHDSELVRLMHIEADARCALRCLGAPRFTPYPAWYAMTENQPTETRLAITMAIIADWDTRPMPPATWVMKIDTIYGGDVIRFLNTEILAA